MIENKALQEVIYYCLGFSKQDIPKAHDFIANLDALPQDYVEKHIFKAHLSGLYYYVLTSLSLEDRASPALKAYLGTQALMREAIREQLDELVPFLRKTGIRPVILKGPAYWGWLYEEDGIRRVNDLDIYIDEAPDRILTFAEELIARGFENPDPDFRDNIFRERTEIPAFTLEKKLTSFSEEDQKNVLLMAGSEFYRSPVYLKDDAWHVKIEIELHKDVFVLVSGDVPVFNSEHFTTSPVLPDVYQIMTKATNLAYLPIKYVSDAFMAINIPAFKNEIKCVKLLYDYMEILRQSDQEAFDESIKVANTWSTMHHYFSLLRSVSRYNPELYESGAIKESDHDYLSQLLEALPGLV